MALAAKFKRETRSYTAAGVEVTVNGGTIPCKLERLAKTKTSAHNGKPYHVVVITVMTKAGEASTVGMTWNTTTEWQRDGEYQAWAEVSDNGDLINWKLELPGFENKVLNLSMFDVEAAEEAAPLNIENLESAV